MHEEKSGLLASLTFVASLAVAIVFVVNSGMAIANRNLQEEIVAAQGELNTKATKIQQNQTFSTIYQSIVQALAASAISKKDDQIKALLIQNEIKLPAPGQAAGKPATGAKAPETAE
jgi:hypothetical protein